MHDPNEELQELKHEAWPGYMKAFIVVFGLSVVYLLIIFLASPWGAVKDLHH